MRKSIPVVLILIILFTVLAICNKKDGTNIDDQLKSGIEWITNIDSALVIAAQENKPIMIDFTATWCPPCRRMEDSTFSDARVIDKFKSFITVRIDVDKQQDVAIKYNSNANKYGGIGIPNYLFLDKEGKELKHPIGFRAPKAFLAVMDSALTIYSNKE
ncbi:thioredoxin family protein [bacterium]|nr:thioredoxin family protein [bacterium]